MDSMVQSCAREIVALHKFFVVWFTGAVPCTQEAFQPVSKALADGFCIVSPRGTKDEREAVLEGLFRAWGTLPALKIWIEQVEHRNAFGDVHLVTYQEWQSNGENSPTARLSTALLQQTQGEFRWLHVHETWLPEALLL